MPIYDRRNRQALDTLVEEYSTRQGMSRRAFLQRATAAGLSVSAASALLAACGGPPSTGPSSSGSGAPAKVSAIDVLTEWGGEELASFQAINAAFTAKSGIKVNVESTRDLTTVLQTRVRGNNPPDVCGMPNLALMYSMADQNKLVKLDSFLDMTKYKSDYGAWVDLASYKGNVYAVLPKANGKGTVWYNPTQFQAVGGTIPQTWDDMISLSDKIAGEGKYPWSIGVESAASSGWPAADWISEIYINKYGQDMYTKWWKHQIPWTDPSIKDAITMFGNVAGGKHYINGAPQAILATNFQDATYAPFTSPPKAYMNYLGDFAAGFITGQFKSLKAGTDFDFFPFPTINAQYKGALTGGADIVVAMKDNDGTHQFMQYLATAEAQTIWVKRGGSTSVNKSVSLDDYPDPVTKKAAQMLTTATAAQLSIGDLVPPALQTAYWKGLLTYIANPGQLDSILSSLEDTAKSAYQS